MDPVLNPFAPGAGSQPPELAGRADVRETVRIHNERLRIGRQAKSVLMVGLRGVGKTVLLDRMMMDAEVVGLHTVRLEAPENRSLPALLAPELRRALLRLSKVAAAKDVAVRGLRALAGFAGKLKLTYNDIEIGFDYEAEPGLADNGDLESDLTALLEQVGRAARAADTVLLIFIDELQYVPEQQLAALISALHRCAQATLPVAVIGAGLPQLRGQMGEAKSYAERLFEFVEIGPLSVPDARAALQKPCEGEGIEIASNALDLIVSKTCGYPYFLQEWGKHAWDRAQASPITQGDAEDATEATIRALDASFFRVRLDRLTPAEKGYLRAMAELGPGPHRSGDIAVALGRDVKQLAPVRGKLIAKGMVWSPSHGDTAFTVPLFDQYMLRAMPSV